MGAAFSRSKSTFGIDHILKANYRVRQRALQRSRQCEDRSEAEATEVYSSGPEPLSEGIGQRPQTAGGLRATKWRALVATSRENLAK